ncbi:MAG: SpvB/TcaC N-terminal domain-containing protein [Myxococcota bacterium]|nr:SpvB/TcaC N-terminal domain-containing protein [Myxococcota bacterium]
MFDLPSFDPGLLRLDHSVQVDRVRGGVTVRVPLRLPEGRDGMGPGLALVRSGSGPSPFGRGWSLAGLPFIGVDTRDGLPAPDKPRTYADARGQRLVLLSSRQDGEHLVQIHALEIDDTRQRFERWIAPDGQDHWRVYSPNGHLEIYGRSARIHHPDAPSDTWRWLLERRVDELGNAICVEYRAEDTRNLPADSPAERARIAQGAFPQRYPQRILYGNTRPVDALSEPDTDWRFQVLLDWGDQQDDDGLATGPSGDWPARTDPFSTYRPGYEVRTWRLCRRILVVHDFPELGGPRIVGEHLLTHSLSPAGAELQSLRFQGRRWNGASTTSVPTPTLQFTTTPPEPQSTFEDTGTQTTGQWVDLLGTGLPGLLRRHRGAWLFRENLGGGRFGPESIVPELPRHVAVAVVTDSDADGNIDLSHLAGPQAGHYSRDRHSGQWSPYSFFRSVAHADPITSRAQWVDLDGDGRPELVVDHGDRLVWYPSLGSQGLDSPRVLPHPAGAPNLRQSAQQHSHFADMSGDGLPDLVQISPGRVTYWPNLGHGRFGAPVEMEDAPFLPDRSRVLWVDTTRSGTADCVVVDAQQVLVYANQRGNGFGAPTVLRGVPRVAQLQDLRVADFYGDGGRCLVWQRPGQSTQVLRLDQGAGAGRLSRVSDGAGVETEIAWRSSAQDFVRDADSARPWRTRLPHHQSVVASLTRIEGVSGARYPTEFTWRDGHFDDHQRSFVGFGQVESGPPPDPDDPSPRALTRSWIHLGIEPRVDREQDFYSGDPGHSRLPLASVQDVPDPTKAQQAWRALAGRVWRQERYAVSPDGSVSEHPLDTTESAWVVHGHGATLRPQQTQQLSHDYQEQPTDPRVQHQLTLETDAHGAATRTATVHYPRRTPEQPGQDTLDIELSEQVYAHVDAEQRLLLDSLVSQRRYTLDSPSASGLLSPDSAVFSGPKTLFSASRTHYWDDTQTAAATAPGLPRLVHHVDVAAFPEGADFWDGQLDSTALSDAGYLLEEGLWWAPGPVRHTSGAFHRLSHTHALDASEVTLAWDADALFTVAQTDELGHTWTRSVDPQSLQPRAVTDPNGNQTQIRFDALGQPIAATLVGTRTGLDGAVHDEGGGDWTPVSLSAALDDPHSAIGDASQVTLYDATRYERGDGPVRWLSLARREHLNDGEGGRTAAQATATLRYLDGLGQPVQIRSLAAPGPAVDASGSSLVADPRWHVSGHQHRDGVGQVIREHEPFFSDTSDYQDDAALQSFGQAIERRWDALGRQIATSRPDGTQTRQDHSPWRTERFDANDLVVGSGWETWVGTLPSDDPHREALRQAQTHAQTPVVQHLDGRGRVVAITESDGTQTRQERTRYGPHDQPLSQEDARGLEATRWERDLSGQALVEHSMDAGTQRIFLDALGREHTRWTASGEELRSTWDTRGQPLERRVDGRLVERWVYGEDTLTQTNAVGRLVEHWDGAGRHRVSSYDALGNALVTSTALRVQSGVVDWGVDTVETDLIETRIRFDALGRARWKQLPDGSERTLDWDPLGQAITLSATLDGSTTDYIQEADYNARGQRARVLYGNGVQAQWAFDPKSFRLSALTASSDTRSYLDIRYTWDPAGNLVHLVDKNQDPGVSDALLQGASVSSAQTFTYDAWYRLRSATGRVHQALLPYETLPGGHTTGRKGTQHLTLNNGAALERYTRSYDYDLAGNLLKTRHAGTSGAWTRELTVSSSSNRSILSVGPDGLPTGSVDSAFDSAGRRSSLPNLRAMDWDHAGQLMRAVIIERTGEPDDDETYTYASSGQRVRRLTQRKVGDSLERIETVYLHGCERRRIYSGDTLILERWTSRIEDQGQRLALVHRWSLDSRGRESADLSTRVHYQIGNHLGSVSLELDADGAIISYEEYLPYGGSAFIAGDRVKEVDLKEYRYSGKIRDDATGLYYYGYRYYAVWIGNWLSPDPAGGVDGMNLYRFVRNNPMRFVDPDGLDSFDSWGVNYDPADGWTAERVKAAYNASGGEYVITGQVRLVGSRWVVDEFARVPRQQSVEDFEIAQSAGILGALNSGEVDLGDSTGIPGLGGQGEQGDGQDGDSQEGQEGGQGEAQEGEAAGESGDGENTSKQGAPNGDPEGTDPDSEDTRGSTTDPTLPPTEETRQGNTDQAVPPPPLDAPLSEDGQAYDPTKGYGGRGERGEQARVGEGSDSASGPQGEETKEGQEFEETWLDTAVTIAGYLNLEFGDGDPDGDRYGLPGGWLGWIPGSRFSQGVYVAASAVMAVVTVVELATGVGEAKLALKGGIAVVRAVGLKGAAKLFWDDAIKKAASLGGMLLRRNKDEAAEGAEAAARIAEFEAYIDGLPSKPTPSNTAQDLYEIAQTGPDNYLISGGGERIWADGLDATQQAALEAKSLVNPGRSPFIPGSAAPPFIRAKITGQVAEEIRRYGAVIADDSNPVRQLIVRVSDSRAVPFFEDLMTRFRVPGRVEVR